MNRLSFRQGILIVLVLLIGTILLALFKGATATKLKDIHAVFDLSVNTRSVNTLRELRIPRIAGALVVGAGLAVAGAITQGITKNPLADPGLLGLTAGSNVALTIALALPFTFNYFSLIIIGILGALLGSCLVFGVIIMKNGKMGPIRIVLAGAAISGFLLALSQGIAIYWRLSKNVAMWSAGGLIGASWDQVIIVALFIIPCIGVSFILGKQLTVLSLDEGISLGLGQDIQKMQKIFFLLTVILTGASVALAGSIAFLGLLIPHVVRSFLGSEYNKILPISAILGGSFMVFADMLSRTLKAPYELSVSAIISFIGLPFFLMIIKRKQGGHNA